MANVITNKELLKQLLDMLLKQRMEIDELIQIISNFDERKEDKDVPLAKGETVYDS